jgi:hypothetical protein
MEKSMEKKPKASRPPGKEPEEPSIAESTVRLERLLAGVTPENLHPEADMGPAVGKEVW